MDRLTYKILNTNPGSTFVSFPVGATINSVIGVWRNGLEHEKVLNANINDGVTRQWAVGPGQKIKFPSSLPFMTGEKIYVMYKYSV